MCIRKVFKESEMLKYTWWCLMGILFATAAQAQTAREGVQSFQQESDAWRRQAAQKAVPLPQIVSEVGQMAIDNIINAEQAFCYQISNPGPSYDGYTLDGMALTGFCGILNPDLRNLLAQQLVGAEANVNFASSEQCIIRPRLMIRFVKGIDATDVLISSPCYSVAIFYGGKVNAFNFKPGGEVLDVMIESFNEQMQPFVSPALLNQLLPVGVPQTQMQQNTARTTATQPLRSPQPAAKVTTSPAKPRTSGWNDLKLNFSN